MVVYCAIELNIIMDIDIQPAKVNELMMYSAGCLSLQNKIIVLL